MEEQLISFETAKLAKEKGYNITNIFSYDETTGLMLPKDSAYPGWHCYTLEGVCPAPTQSLLQKWLREKHNIHIEISYGKDKTNVWFNPNIYSLIKPQDDDDLDYYNYLYAELLELDQYDSYEKALEIGLYEALKLI